MILKQIDSKDKENINLFIKDLEKEYDNDKETILNFDEEKGKIEEKIGFLYALIDKKKVVGYLVTEEGDEKDSIIFHHVFVKEKFRGKGYGKEIVNMGLDLAYNLGYKNVSFAARPHKEGFYFACGLKGSGLFQAEVDVVKKKDMEEFLNTHGIKKKDYKYNNWKNLAHQFFFQIPKNFNYDPWFNDAIKKDMYFQVLFEVDLEKEYINENNMMKTH